MVNTPNPSSPYSQGYEAALIPPPEQPTSPYSEGSKEHDQWWEGYGDATEDAIRAADLD